MEPNFNNFKCRCSRIADILSDSKETPPLTEKQEQELKELESKVNDLTAAKATRLTELKLKKDKNLTGEISLSHMELLLEWYAEETEGMISVTKELAYMPAAEKGTELEPEAGLLVSQVHGEILKVHKDRIYNDYLSGEIDFYTGESVDNAKAVFDTKNSYDYPIYLKKLKQKVTSQNENQVQGYMDIMKISEGYIADVLLSFTEGMVMDAVQKLIRKHNVISEESPDQKFQAALAKLLRSMNFDQIDYRLRVNLRPIQPFSKYEQQKLYDRVKLSRDWLNTFHNERIKLLN